MKEIPLTQGMVALVDDDMYEFLDQWKWHASKSGDGLYYARRNERDSEKRKSKRIYMHRLIMNAPAGTLVDHRDPNKTLDNRRENLRVCSKSQNAYNARISKRNKSGYRGVYRKNERWQAGIRINNRSIHIGYFTNPVEAAKAYDAKARELFGEFARTNF